MTERVVEIDHVDWKRTFPWVRLFRAFGTAVDLRMLLLGSLALVALAVGDAIFIRLPFAPDAPAPFAFRWDEPVRTIRPLELPDAVLRNPWSAAWGANWDWGAVLRPARTVVYPAQTILRASATWSEKALAWTRLIWAILVWAIFAGAMTRIAAVEHARETRVSVVSSLKFASQNVLSYLTAVLLPAAGVAVFWILCVIGGWIGRLPYVGQPLLGLLWGLELIFGFMMTLILIGAVAGWPLMYATISTEGSDGFDGFSRAYSYVFSRPWHYLWFAVVAIAYGTIVTAFVSFVALLVTYLSAAGVSSGLGFSTTGGLLLGAGDSVGGPGVITRTPASEIGIGTLLVGAWLQGVALLVSAFVTSFFWTASTVIYLLLRHVDDATAFREVYLPEEKEVDDLLPLVGVAASSQPVIERPLQGDAPVGPTVPHESLPPGKGSGEPVAWPKNPTEFDSTAP